MKIFILRHGITGDAETDAERDLTSAGRQEVVKIVRQKVEDLQGIKRIYSSPMVRVKNTIDIAKNLMGFEGEVIVEPNLNAGSRLPELNAFMDSIDPSAGDIMISSHQSCTSILVLVLTGEDLLIPNGSLICIETNEVAQGKGKIVWQESASGAEIKRTENFVDFV